MANINYYADHNITGTLTTSGVITSGGVITAPGGTSTQWNTSYDNMITGLAVTGTTTKTLTATQQDGGTITASWADDSGSNNYLTSLSFNTGNGILTAARQGLSSVTVDLDGRYALSSVVSGVTSVATTNGITGGTITSTGTIQVDSTVVRTTGAQTIANLKTFTERTDFTNAAGIKTNQVTTYGGQQLVLNAGESSSYATGQTGESVYLNAEAGLEINSSPDNWSSGWAGRSNAYINRADATSYLPGVLTVKTGITLTGTGRIQGVDTVSASTDAANKAYVDASVPSVGNGTFTVTGNTGLSGSGSMTANQSGNSSATLTNTDRGSSQNIYKNFTASSGGTATANSNNDTLTIAAGTNVTTVRSGDTITINATNDGQGVTSVNFKTDGTALNVASNSITTSGTMTGVWQGSSSEYVNGEGDLVSFPSIPQGDITAVVAGTGMSGGGSSGSVTLNCTITNTNQLTNGAGYITASSSDTLTNKSGNISQWTNNSGYITSSSLPTVNNPTITITTATGLDGATSFTLNQSSAKTIALSLDLSELTDMTAAMTATDEFIVLDSGAERRKAAGEIGLSIFNNDAGFITSSSIPSVGNGTLTVQGTGVLGGSGTFTANQSGNSTISVTHDNSGVSAATYTAATIAVNATGHITSASSNTIPTNNNQLTNGAGYITSASLPSVGNGTLTMSTSTGLDGSASFTANQSGNSSFAVTLDLSELTDMTGAISPTVDEVILLDNGAERRKRFSEIFGSNAYNSTTIPTNNNQLTNGAGYITSASVPSVGNGQIDGRTSGNGLSGSMDATANQSGNTTFTVTSNATTAATASTIAYRDSSADLNVRLLRANYANESTISGAIAFRNNNSTDNYTRYCSSPSAIRAFIGAGTGSGDITGVTAGTNLTGGGTSGTVTLNMATGGVGAGTYGSTSNATKIDNITVDAYGRVTAITTGGTGDIDGVTAGSGLTGGGTSGSVTVAVDYGSGGLINDAPIASPQSAEADDYMLIGDDSDGGTTRRVQFTDVGLSNFDNDAGFTSNTGDITAVVAGNKLTGGGTSGSVTLGLASNNISQWTNDSGYTTNVGDITGVTAGTNLTGGGTSGSVTLNMATGGVGAGSYGSTSNSTKIDNITVDAYGRVTAVTTGATGSGNGSVTSIATTAPILGGTITSSGTISLRTPVSGNWHNGGAIVVGTDGLSEIGRYLDFHTTNTSTGDYDVRLQADTSGKLHSSATIRSEGNLEAVGNMEAGYLRTTYGSQYQPSHSFTSDTNTGMYRPGTDQIGFAAGGANRMNISTSAISTTVNLGVGTSSPSTRLHVDGVGLIRDSNGVGDFYLGNYATANHFRFHTNNSNTYFDMNCGNIYWRDGGSTRYTFFPSTANMTVNGTITQNSDSRVKENVVEISDCISKVQAMRGVYYNRTDINTEATKVGVIAQEVETVLPELIIESPENGLKSVAYSELTAVLINAIKEQQEIIEDLKTRIIKLEK